MFFFLCVYVCVFINALWEQNDENRVEPGQV